MTDQAANDYTWHYPNRRFIDEGLYLPSLHSEGMPPIVFAVDTSGSIDEFELAAIWGEVRHIAQDLQPERVIVVQCDAAVTDVAEYAPMELPATLTAQGRGGTKYSPTFAWVDQEMLTAPACLIYCTDLYCSDYPSEPTYPVLWAAVGNAEERLTPPWGYRVNIQE